MGNKQSRSRMTGYQFGPRPSMSVSPSMSGPSSSVSGGRRPRHSPETHPGGIRRERVPRHVALASHSRESLWTDTVSNEDLRFCAYNEIDGHHAQTFDTRRVKAYMAAIKDRHDFISGAFVLDVGCGPGVISMYCAKKGAKTVYGVEATDVIHEAMSNSRENDVYNVVYVQKDLYTLNSPRLQIPKMDVIIAEFSGHMLFFDGMTEAFIIARDNYLRKDGMGLVMPRVCEVEVAPLGTKGPYAERIECWRNVYGFRMPSMETRALHEVVFDYIDTDHLIGGPVTVKKLDLALCGPDDVFIDTTFNLDFYEDTEICALVAYFTLVFDGSVQDICLSTAPGDPQTHWKQVVFFLPTPLEAKTSSGLPGRIRASPSTENPKWVVVHISFGELTHRYELR